MSQISENFQPSSDFFNQSSFHQLHDIRKDLNYFNIYCQYITFFVAILTFTPIVITSIFFFNIITTILLTIFLAPFVSVFFFEASLFVLPYILNPSHPNNPKHRIKEFLELNHNHKELEYNILNSISELKEQIKHILKSSISPTDIVILQDELENLTNIEKVLITFFSNNQIQNGILHYLDKYDIILSSELTIQTIINKYEYIKNYIEFNSKYSV